MRMLAGMILAVMLLIMSLPVHAAAPNNGDRVPPLRGWDMVHDEVADIEDHLGQWVYLEFWDSR
jgi:hypothetical protein